MSVCERLHLPEDEVERWPLNRLARWLAYFKIVQEEEKKAIDRANKAARNKR